MRKFLHRFLPQHETILNQRWIRYFGRWLQQPNMWHLNRRSVAGGVSVGLLCGLIPGPFQVIGSVFFSALLRVNLPVAIFTTFYTNPFTILPLYALAYQIGVRVAGINGRAEVPNLVFPELQWHDWVSELWIWMLKLGEPLLIGLPLLALSLSLCGYVLVRLGWRTITVWKWRSRARHRRACKRN